MIRAERIRLIEWHPAKYEDNQNFYSEENLEDFVYDDVISSAEEGFMLGYMNA